MMSLSTKGGAPRRYVYGRTPEEVQRKWEIRNGTPRYRRGSLSEFVAVYFSAWLASRVQQSTLERYDSIWSIHLEPALGALRFDELTPSLIEPVITGLKSGSSQAIARGLLRQMFELAIAHRQADHALLSMLRTVRVRPVKAKVRLNVEDRTDELLRNLEGHYAYGIIWTISTLGLRKGEACGLMRSDLDDNNILTIQRQRNHKGVSDRLKRKEAGETRRVALPASIAERLRGFMAPEGWAFRNDRGEPISYHHLDRIIAFAQPSEPLTIHCLRAAAVSHLFDAGVEERIIMDIVGHMDPSMLAVYRDRRDERIRKALEP